MEDTETDMPITKANTQTEAIQFQIVETKPRFQGGDESTFSTWVNQQITYPQSAKDNGIQGRVILTFIVDTDGSVRNVKVLRGIDPLLDNEAIRAVSSSPKWTPGKHKGEPVQERYLPIICSSCAGV